MHLSLADICLGYVGGSFLDHHCGRQKLVFKNLVRVYALAGVQAHYLIEEVDEVCIFDPFVTIIVKSFLKDRQEVA